MLSPIGSGSKIDVPQCGSTTFTCIEARRRKLGTLKTNHLHGEMMHPSLTTQRISSQISAMIEGEICHTLLCVSNTFARMTACAAHSAHCSGGCHVAGVSAGGSDRIA